MYSLECSLITSVGYDTFRMYRNIDTNSKYRYHDTQYFVVWAVDVKIDIVERDLESDGR